MNKKVNKNRKNRKPAFAKKTGIHSQFHLKNISRQTKRIRNLTRKVIRHKKTIKVVKKLVKNGGDEKKNLKKVNKVLKKNKVKSPRKIIKLIKKNPENLKKITKVIKKKVNLNGKIRKIKKIKRSRMNSRRHLKKISRQSSKKSANTQNKLLKRNLKKITKKPAAAGKKPASKKPAAAGKKPAAAAKKPTAKSKGIHSEGHLKNVSRQTKGGSEFSNTLKKITQRGQKYLVSNDGKGNKKKYLLKSQPGSSKSLKIYSIVSKNGKTVSVKETKKNLTITSGEGNIKKIRTYLKSGKNVFIVKKD